MTTKPKQTFSCPACGRSFPWKSEYAGRKVKCKCGNAFEARLNQPVPLDEPVALDEPVSMAMREPEPAPRRASARADAQSTTVQVGNLPYAIHTRRVEDMAADQDQASVFRDWVIPIALLLIGMGARFSQVLFFASKHQLSTKTALGLLVCEMVIGGVALIAGAFAASAILSTEFGEPRRAAVKILAIAIFTSAAAYLAASIDREPEGIRGMVLAWHLVLLLYFILFVYLFKLDLQEGVMTTVIVMAIQLVLMFVISRGLSPEMARTLMYG